MRNILLTPASDSLRPSEEMFERPYITLLRSSTKEMREEWCERKLFRDALCLLHSRGPNPSFFFFFLNDPPSLYASFCLLSTWKSFPHVFKCVHILTGAFLCVYSCGVAECLAAFVLIFFVLAARWARGPVVSQALVERRISWSASGSLCRQTRRCRPK